MATRDDVLDAIRRIETAGGAGDATRTAQAALTLPLPLSGYDRLLDQLRSAYPRILGIEQRGRAAQAMKDAEVALRHQLSAAAEFDRQIIEALRHAHQTTVQGRRRLDVLEAEIAGAAQAWDLSTAPGAREFQRFLIAKLGEIIRVVEVADDDDTSEQALATALTTLYATHTGPDDPVPDDPVPDPAGGTAPLPAGPTAAALADPQGEPYPDPYPDPYLDALPADQSEPGYSAAPPHPSAMPAMPAVPGFGGESPGFGAIPPVLPAGLPSTRGGEELGDDYLPGDTAPVEDTSSDDPDGGGFDDAPASSPDHGPVTVRLPDGVTIAVADPQLAAAMQAAADGTPVTEAFRRQGMDIPPPGTPVVSPVDPARLRPGDIGVFIDRHAVAVGDGKALLDGQIHLTGNLRGPGFLGWQHLPVRGGAPESIGEPVPTSTAGVLRA